MCSYTNRYAAAVRCSTQVRQKCPKCSSSDRVQDAHQVRSIHLELDAHLTGHLIRLAAVFTRHEVVILVVRVVVGAHDVEHEPWVVDLVHFAALCNKLELLGEGARQTAPDAVGIELQRPVHLQV